MLIGGKAFQVVDLERRTVRHDGFLMALLIRTGIDMLTPQDGEDAEAFAFRVLQTILQRDAAVELAAAFLLPDGTDAVDWSPALAAEIRAHIERCNTEEDRSTVYRISAEQVLGFFRLRLLSLATSLNSWAAEVHPEKRAAA